MTYVVEKIRNGLWTIKTPVDETGLLGHVANCTSRREAIATARLLAGRAGRVVISK